MNAEPMKPWSDPENVRKTVRAGYAEKAQAILAGVGQMYAGRTCLKLRQSSGSEIRPLSSRQDLFAIVNHSDKLGRL